MTQHWYLFNIWIATPKTIAGVEDVGHRVSVWYKTQCLLGSTGNLRSNKTPGSCRSTSHIMKVTLLIVMCTLVVLLQGMETEAGESIRVSCYSNASLSHFLLHPVLCYSGTKCNGVVTLASTFECCSGGGSYREDFGLSCTSWWVYLITHAITML